MNDPMQPHAAFRFRYRFSRPQQKPVEAVSFQTCADCHCGEVIVDQRKSDGMLFEGKCETCNGTGKVPARCCDCGELIDAGGHEQCDPVLFNSWKTHAA